MTRGTTVGVGNSGVVALGGMVAAAVGTAVGPAVGRMAVAEGAGTGVEVDEPDPEQPARRNIATAADINSFEECIRTSVLSCKFSIVTTNCVTNGGRRPVGFSNILDPLTRNPRANAGRPYHGTIYF